MPAEASWSRRCRARPTTKPRKPANTSSNSSRSHLIETEPPPDRSWTGMPSLPRGTVTLLLTDIQGSTLLWERQTAAMRAAVARHDDLAESIITEGGGALLKHRGE